MVIKVVNCYCANFAVLHIVRICYIVDHYLNVISVRVVIFIGHLPILLQAGVQTEVLEFVGVYDVSF